MKLKALISLLLISLSSISQGNPLILEDFSTDGCSSYPDGHILTKKNEWIHCCIAHDMSYWIGGTREERQLADENLGACIEERTNEFHGNIMQIGVIFGGTPRLRTNWRWGYGWSEQIQYQLLNNDQREAVAQKFDTILDTIEEQKLEGEIDMGQNFYLVVEYEKLRRKIYQQYHLDQNRGKEEDQERARKIYELLLDPAFLL